MPDYAAQSPQRQRGQARPSPRRRRGPSPTPRAPKKASDAVTLRPGPEQAGRRAKGPPKNATPRDSGPVYLTRCVAAKEFIMKRFFTGLTAVALTLSVATGRAPARDQHGPTPQFHKHQEWKSGNT